MSDVIKIALIGCGGRGKGAAQNNLTACERTKIVAVADAFENNAKEAAKMFKVAPEKTFWGLDAYKKAIAADVDMVIMAAPPGFRPLHYKAAIEAGKHVFMEKPCCVDAPGYRSLVETNELADKKGLKVGVGLQRRHNKGYVNGIAQIHDGKIGDLILLQAYWNGGGIWWRDGKEDWSEMKKQVDNWYHYCWLSGDNICEQHIHNLDVCNWAKNAHPVEANGMGGDQIRRALYPRIADLRSPLRGVHLPRRHQDVQPVPARPEHLQSRRRVRLRHEGQRSMQADGNVKDANGRRFQVRRLRSGTLRPGGRHSPQSALQRRALRRHEQHDLRARPHGDLQRQYRHMGRSRGEGQAGSRPAWKTSPGTPRRQSFRTRTAFIPVPSPASTIRSRKPAIIRVTCNVMRRESNLGWIPAFFR